MPATDDFAHNTAGLSSPFEHGVAVAPSDAEDLPHLARALFVGAEGDLAVVTKGGETLLFAGMRGWLPGRIARVKATGTSAGAIVAVW
ncbi:spike base protein, RCAP_Rcc01079 family [Prosthecomicrobium pneumaticum]|uniref:Uncharacterized protein n=1 Tax=Prosthecomicrobium pneumaticum TaxID=81895 RepID=A0A7W9FR04_9HYPH|nr:hypothetical protein [Prosthecomicrobium pneumaticum]MBB5755277.1 hypothetical protein [Prosthecomicrobium pneumaticum]